MDRQSKWAPWIAQVSQEWLHSMILMIILHLCSFYMERKLSIKDQTKYHLSSSGYTIELKAPFTKSRRRSMMSSTRVKEFPLFIMGKLRKKKKPSSSLIMPLSISKKVSHQLFRLLLGH